MVGDSDNHSIVRVGGMGGHPMKKDHAIEWVEIISFCGAHHRRFLEADDEPESWFLPPVEHVMKARAYCGKHGLWKWEKKDWFESILLRIIYLRYITESEPAPKIRLNRLLWEEVRWNWQNGNTWIGLPQRVRTLWEDRIFSETRVARRRLFSSGNRYTRCTYT